MITSNIHPQDFPESPYHRGFNIYKSLIYEFL